MLLKQLSRCDVHGLGPADFRCSLPSLNFKQQLSCQCDVLLHLSEANVRPTLSLLVD